MTLEKKKALKGIKSDLLLEIFINRVTHFNPCDFEMCEEYEVIKSEILERMKGESKQ